MHPYPPDDKAVTEISQQQQQSWFYYLTEITLRRISNRIVNALYASDYRFWTEDDLPTKLQAAEDFDKQLQDWCVLPTYLQINDAMAA